MKRQPDDRGLHLGRRPERPGGQLQQTLDARPVTDENGQDAVVLRPRRRRQAHGDLALQHDRRVDERQAFAGEFDQLEEDRRGDVVGQVAGDAERRAGGRDGFQRAADVVGSRLQEIAFDDVNIGRRGIAQEGRQVAVDFEGQRPSARAD